MKKFLLTFAALAFGFAAQAQDNVVYDFSGLKATDFQITENGSAEMTTYKMDSYEGPAINFKNVKIESVDGEGNTVTVDQEMEVKIKDIIINYKNSSKKDNCVKTGENYIQFDSKNFILTIPNVPANSYVNLFVSAKGSTNAVFDGDFSKTTNTSGKSEEVSKQSSVDDYIVVSFIAKENGDVKIKETAGGFRISKIVVSSTVATAVSNISAEKSAKVFKTVENGQMIIVKNGVKYNVLGQIVK